MMRYQIKRKLFAVTTALAAVSLTVAAQASVMSLVDFSNATALTTPPDGNGNYWNTVGSNTVGSGASDVSNQSLVDSSNASTPWSISVAFEAKQPSWGNPRVGFGGNGISGPAPTPSSSPLNQSFAIKDGIFSSGNDALENTSGYLATVTFSGLSANTTYDFSAVGGRANNGQDGNLAVITGTPTSNLTLANSGAVLNFSATSNASGQIAFTFESSQPSTVSGSATFNAMSIASGDVPEPASIVLLLGLCGIALLPRQSRRHA